MVVPVGPDSGVARTAPTVSQPSVSRAVGLTLTYRPASGDHVSHNEDHALACGEINEFQKCSLNMIQRNSSYGSLRYIKDPKNKQ